MHQLRSYQKEAARACLDHLAWDRPTLLVAPTGSGKTIIAAEVARHFRRPLIIAHRRELLEQAQRAFDGHVHTSSVQGALSPDSDLPSNVDLLIIDEAHRSAAKTYRGIIKRFAHSARLGLTATPLRTDGRGLCDVFSVIVETSDMRALVASGDLVPYRAFEAPDAALEQLDSMKRKAGDYDQGELAKLMDHPRLVGSIVREYEKHGRGRKAVAFAVNIEHSRHIEAAFRAAGIRASHIDGRATEKARRAALDDLATGRMDVLCNVNLFTEGWDCPAVSCVIMARPTESLTLYLQSVGRGMRPFEGKADLVILDHAGNVQRHGYPDLERDWTLENEIQKRRREAEMRRTAQVRALGYSSLEEYELEQKRIAESSYSSEECAALLNLSYSALGSLFRKVNVRRIAGKTNACRYSREDVDSLVKIYADTYSYSEACAVLPAGVRHLNSFLKCRGIVPHFGAGPAVRYLKRDVDALIGKYTERECAAILGLPRAASFMVNNGIVPVKLGPGRCSSVLYPKADVDKLAALKADSCTLREVAQSLGLSKSRAAQVLREAGVQKVIGNGHTSRWRKVDVDALAIRRMNPPKRTLSEDQRQQIGIAVRNAKARKKAE